jgi:hypothetical protein
MSGVRAHSVTWRHVEKVNPVCCKEIGIKSDPLVGRHPLELVSDYKSR